MSKRIILILVMAALLILGVSLKVMTSAQTEDSGYGDISRLQEKIDRVLDLLKSREGSEKEILSRLDRILSNQAEMKEQLYIIKIRASR